VTTETGERIYSNEYADLLLYNVTNLSVIERLQDATVQIIDPVSLVARVPVNLISNKIMVQFGYNVMPVLSGLISQESLEASGITRIRNMPALNLRGQGVLIGLLDTGIDYTNPLFLNTDNTTRIAALWDQTIIGEDYTSNTFYGTEYTREQINQALQNSNPYDIVPSKDEIGHGTMLAGIAAGNEEFERNFSGVVPDAELVIVKLKPAKQYLKDFWKIPKDAICYQENDIVYALEYLEQTANKLGRPMSICIALGSSQGSHDNTSILNRNLSLRAQNLNFSIAVAAGNEGNARRHYYGIIDPIVGYDIVELNVGDNEEGFSMELWGDSPGLFAISITTPSGEFIPRVLPRINEQYSVSFIFENTVIHIDYQVIEKQSGDQLILLRFDNPAPGIWKFRVYGKVDLILSYHIWLPMGNFISDNTFFIRSDPYTTILSMGNANVPITVTAYNMSNNSLYFNASMGYTRIGNIKPEIAAPGVNIISPTINQEFSEVSGSSPAAAHTAGVAAMLLEWGIVKGNLPSMNTTNVKVLMARGAKRNIDQIYPNREWGYGILDVFNIYNRLRETL
jgi:subtilisin family serine protease